MKNEINTLEDDGTLAFLKIEPDKSNRHFNCGETTQQKLVNTTFHVMDYVPGVKTKHGDDRYVVKIKHDLSDPESKAEKFFTNSQEIKYVLDKVAELDAFPRRVTMRANGTRYYLE